MQPHFVLDLHLNRLATNCWPNSMPIVLVLMWLVLILAEDYCNVYQLVDDDMLMVVSVERERKKME